MPQMPESLPEPEAGPAINTRQIASPAYRHSIVNTNEIPFAALLTYIEGMNYVVEYYSQILGRDEAPTPYDISQSPVYQSYDRIHTFLLKLQGDLTPSYEDGSTELTVSGTAVVLPVIVPNRGDVFIGDSGDGNAMLFAITDVRPMSYRKQPAYEIDFRSIEYMNLETEHNLTDKVVKELYFSQASLATGQNPLLASAEYIAKGMLKELYKQTLNRFLNDFFSYEYSTILVGGQEQAVYDHYATSALLRVVDVTDDRRIPNIKLFNIADYGLDKRVAFWNGLIDKDPSQRDQAFQHYGLARVEQFNPKASLRSVRFSGVRYCVVPADPDLTVDARVRGEIMITDQLEVPAYTGAPIASLGESDYYVLGMKFYDEMRGSMYKLEQLCDKVLNKEMNTPEELASTLLDVNKLQPVHRFYYQLVLLILLKLELRNA